MKNLSGVDNVISSVCKHYKVTKRELLISKRGVENVARDTAIYLVRRLCCKTLPNVGTEFGINNYSTVSSVVQRVKKRIEADKTLQRDLQIIEGYVNKDRKQTCPLFFFFSLLFESELIWKLNTNTW